MADRVVYYNDPVNDDFAGTSIKQVKVDKNFTYIHKNPFWRFISWILYFCVALPIVWSFERIFLRVKFANKKAMKKVRGQKVFMYGNHTGFIDAFTPNILSFPTRNRILVGADTVSIKCMKNITQMLGAIPIPNSPDGMIEFSKAVAYYHDKSNITIYPEAHIWPYYTGVREFSDNAFSYPARLGSPVIAFFTAYTKPKGFLSCFRKANVTIYVSDPIYADEGLSPRAARKNLRDKVYAFMLEKSKLSDYEVIQYIDLNSVSEEAV